MNNFVVNVKITWTDNGFHHVKKKGYVIPARNEVSASKKGMKLAQAECSKATRTVHAELIDVEILNTHTHSTFIAANSNVQKKNRFITASNLKCLNNT